MHLSSEMLLPHIFHKMQNTLQPQTSIFRSGIAPRVLARCSHASSMPAWKSPPAPRAGASEQGADADCSLSKRSALLGIASIAAGVLVPSATQAASPTRKAGDYCPPASTPGFVVYSPKDKATPVWANPQTLVFHCAAVLPLPDAAQLTALCVSCV